jgi:hypothetical protein
METSDSDRALETICPRRVVQCTSWNVSERMTTAGRPAGLALTEMREMMRLRGEAASTRQ